MKRAQGDLLVMARAGEFNVIVHGCNCLCRMNSGIARQIRDEYPEAHAADSATRPGDIDKLGNYTEASTRFGAEIGQPFTIINAYTQFDINSKDDVRDRFEYASFETILRKLAHRWPDRRYGFPYIGMGLAGGDVVKITNLLKRFSNVIEDGGGSVTLVQFERN